MPVVRSSPSASRTPSTIPSASAYVSPSATPSPDIEESLKQRVYSAFERLSASAGALNIVSDELSKPISAIDAALKSLNLGVTAWVSFAGTADPNTGDFWDRSVGYAKVGGKWGITISASSGCEYDDRPTHEESWLFADAPRSYRLDAAEKLPELLEKLVTAAEETTEKLKETISTTTAVAKAIYRTPTLVKEALLEEIKSKKPSFYSTVVARAEAIELTTEQLVFHVRASQAALVAAVQENHGWLEELVLQQSGWDVTVVANVIHDAAKK